ncbi:unnamed protein product, partial [Prorocentrum cordatum]
QEKKQQYKVYREDISEDACPFNHRTLQRAEMVEFFDTGKKDEKHPNLIVAKTITGPYGAQLKTSYEYRLAMYAAGGIPAYKQDTPEDYPVRKKVCEYYLRRRFNGMWKMK